MVKEKRQFFTKLKLQWKIFFYLLGLSVVLIAILWIFQTVYLNSTYQFIRRFEIRQAIELVQEHIESETLRDILYDLELSKDIIVSPTKDFSPPPIPGPDAFARNPVETITMEEVFTLSSGQEIRLTFFAITSPVEATVRTLRLQLLFITFIILILTLLLAILISKRIASPIVKLNEDAKKLAKPNPKADFKATGFQEIHELATTLNTVAVDLSEVERLRRDLIANVSHDLRTPLALIYSHAELMHDFPKEVLPLHSQTIMEETKRLTALVNDILMYSQLEEQGIHLDIQPFDFTSSIQAVCTQMQALVKKDSLRIEFIHDTVVKIRADEQKLKQVLYNLLANAITHGKEEDLILVLQTVDDGMLTIEVTDHGEGIAPDELPYIWDRYYKVQHQQMKSGLGSGLGLSIVKDIVEAHLGTCNVESTVGVGSTFSFSLPRT